MKPQYAVFKSKYISSSLTFYLNSSQLDEGICLSESKYSARWDKSSFDSRQQNLQIDFFVQFSEEHVRSLVLCFSQRFSVVEVVVVVVNDLSSIILSINKFYCKIKLTKNLKNKK